MSASKNSIIVFKDEDILEYFTKLGYSKKK